QQIEEGIRSNLGNIHSLTVTIRETSETLWGERGGAAPWTQNRTGERSLLYDGVKWRQTISWMSNGPKGESDPYNVDAVFDGEKTTSIRKEADDTRITSGNTAVSAVTGSPLQLGYGYSFFDWRLPGSLVLLSSADMLEDAQRRKLLQIKMQ